MPAKVAHASAVAAIYADHHRWLFGWLRRKLGCPENAADLAQETYAPVITRAKACGTTMWRLDELREPRAFLVTIAHGLVVSHWRRVDVEHAYRQALAVQPPGTSPSTEEQALVVVQHRATIDDLEDH